MDNPTLVSAAVKAVEDGQPLRWNRLFKHGGTTWQEFRCATAWVSRERKKRKARPDGVSPAPERNAASKAALALQEAAIAKEVELAEQERLRLNPLPPPRTFEQKTTEFLKGFGLQFLWLLILFPLSFLLGFDYRGGLIGILSGVLFFIGVVTAIVVFLFRFVRALVVALTSGKPFNKKWYE